MCGRFTNKDPQAIYEEYKIDIRANYNVTPSSSILTITDKPEMMLWAYNPTWAKKPFNLINARSETLNEKPSFRMAKRCLIIADGWYEWKRTNNQKIPYFHHCGDDLIYFAGIYNLESGCAVVTRESHSNISHVHHRQPVLLEEFDIGEFFMGEDKFDSEINADVSFHMVSKDVNIPSNNYAELTKEIT